MLTVTNFTVGIPADSTVLGIEVAIEGNTTNSNLTGEVSLTKDGTSSVGTSKSFPLTQLGDTTDLRGGDSDLWGTTWTPAEINATTFGVRIGAVNTDPINSQTINVDSVQLNVYYSQDAPVVTQKAYPDADTDASTWTTTPLWSKVDEPDTPSDTDFITATAS